MAGGLVGLSVGLTGMGGGALMTPLLVLVFGVDPTAAVGSDLLASVVMKPVGAVVHQRAGTVRWELVRLLVPTALPAAFAGAFILHLLGNGAALQDRLKLAIGGALLVALLGMAVRAVITRRRGKAGPGGRPLRVRAVPTLLVGLAGGLVVGLTSVGSGSLIMVMLMLLYPDLRANDLVGTDLVQAIPIVGAATLGHIVTGDVHLGLTAPLLIGALPGIYLGARASATVPSAGLEWVLSMFLLGSSSKLFQVSTPLTLAVCGGATLVVAVSARPRRRAALKKAAG